MLYLLKEGFSLLFVSHRLVKIFDFKRREKDTSFPHGSFILKRHSFVSFRFFSFLFVSFRFFSFLFHTLKRKGGAHRTLQATLTGLVFFSFPLKEKGPFRREKEKSCPFSFLFQGSLILKRHSFVSFRFFSFLFHTLKRTLIKRNEKGGQRTGYKQKMENKGWKTRDGKQGIRVAPFRFFSKGL